MIKPSIVTEPVIVLANGKMAVRTTITCYIDEKGAYDIADFLVDALNEYKKRNIQIVIDVTD